MGQQVRAVGRVVVLLGTIVASGLLASACFGGSPSPSAHTPAQLLNAGVKALIANNQVAAKRDFQQILSIDPGNAHGENKIADYDLGVIAQAQKDVPSASADYKRAIAIDPNYYAAEYNLAIVETPAQPFDAVALYKKVVAGDPSNVNAVYNLGLLLYGLKLIPEGQMYLSQAIAADPSLAQKLPAGVTP